MKRTLCSFVLASTLALTGCNRGIEGEYHESTVVSAKTYTPARSSSITTIVGKVPVTIPTLIPPAYHVFVRLSDGTQYPILTTPEAYASIREGECFDVTFETRQRNGDVPRLVAVKSWSYCR